MGAGFSDAHDELHRALDRNELLLAYQPIIDLRDGTVGGVEALLRWNHPARGLLWPSAFLPEIDDTELATRLGSFVIDAAADQAAAWRSQLPGCAFMVAVNVSARHLEADELLVHLASAQRRNDLDPGALALEIDEQTLFANIVRNRTRLESLERLGTRIVVDDFGAAYSTPAAGGAGHLAVDGVGASDGLLLPLVLLEELPIDVIAIDRTLWERLTTGRQDAVLVDAAVHVAHRFGFRVLAEGVETAAEADELRDRGCDLAQGYYFHRPQPADYIELLLREARDARRERVLRRSYAT
jgi:EAL domain-containing protein (putative c-di-GMP-specific phosphodiesterase class I)